MKRFRLLALTLGLLLALSPAVASAAIYTLADGNSTATIDTASSSGMYDWNVNGVDQLYQQWFWYRVGNQGDESAISTLTEGIHQQFAPNILQLNYSSDQFSISILYSLTGGSALSSRSDIAETIRITNTSDEALPFHFFQYTDFDLSGAGGDTIQILGGNTAVQTGQGILTETVAAPFPYHYEANLFAATRNKFSDGLPTTLNDDAGPYAGDATWAFEWDPLISAGGDFIISKDKNLVPLPPTVLLLGSGLLGLVGLGWRRRK